MAELRDRYKAHGFDDNGNDNNMKIFEKATKQLLEFPKILQQEYKKEFEQTREEYSKNLQEIKRAVEPMGGVVGKAAKSSIGNAMATATQAIVGGAGPIGYILEKTLNLSGGVKALVDTFGEGGRKSSLSSRGEIPKVSSEKTRKESRDTFESYPTIVKLRSWLNFQTKDNPLFRKYMLTMQARAKEQSQFEREQKKERANFKKIFEKLRENSDKQALKTSLIVGGVLLGAAALVGLGAWVKSEYNKRFGAVANTTMQDMTATTGKAFTSGDWASQIRQSSGYGVRTIRTATGATTTRTHKGIDLAVPSNSPVKSLTPGVAYARMQLKGKSGFYDFKKAKDRKDLEQFAGYGIFVDVVCSPATAQRMGYAGRQVTLRYAHLSGVAFSGQGVKVNAGQIIGFAGSTGDSTGPHVHFEVIVDGMAKPASSLGTSLAYDEAGSLGNQWTVNPNSLKFYDPSGKLRTPTDAYVSWSGMSLADYNRRQADLEKKKTAGQEVMNKPPVVTRAGDVLTGGNIVTGFASNLSMSGKNDVVMGTNNMSYNSTKAKNQSSQQQGYVGSLPTLNQGGTSTTPEQPKFELNFDIQNSATKALKQADKSIEFMKV